MFRIITPDGLVLLTEKPNYIRMHKNGETSILCEKDKAEGVACNGKFYLFKDGLQCHEIDGGKLIEELTAENNALKVQLAATEDALCEIDSVNEMRMASIEDALCELDMGGSINE